MAVPLPPLFDDEVHTDYMVEMRVLNFDTLIILVNLLIQVAMVLPVSILLPGLCPLQIIAISNFVFFIIFLTIYLVKSAFLWVNYLFKHHEFFVTVLANSILLEPILAIQHDTEPLDDWIKYVLILALF